MKRLPQMLDTSSSSENSQISKGLLSILISSKEPSNTRTAVQSNQSKSLSIRYLKDLAKAQIPKNFSSSRQWPKTQSFQKVKKVLTRARKDAARISQMMTLTEKLPRWAICAKRSLSETLLFLIPIYSQKRNSKMILIRHKKIRICFSPIINDIQDILIDQWRKGNVLIEFALVTVWVSNEILNLRKPFTKN